MLLPRLSFFVPMTSEQEQTLIYLVTTLRVRFVTMAQRELPLVFSSLEKAEEYCLLEVKGWVTCERDNYCWNGTTNFVGGVEEHFMEIIPMPIDPQPEVWEVSHMSSNVAKSSTLVNGPTAARMFIENQLQLETVSDNHGWQKLSDFHWINEETKEAYIASAKE